MYAQPACRFSCRSTLPESIHDLLTFRCFQRLDEGCLRTTIFRVKLYSCHEVIRQLSQRYLSVLRASHSS